MTDEVKTLSKLEALGQFAPDIAGVLGLTLLTWGLWAGWGQAIALSVCGTILLSLSIASVFAGARK